MNIMLMLVKREFWEHRSLWMAPLIWVGVLLFLSGWAMFFQARHMDGGVMGAHVTIEQSQDHGGADKPGIELRGESADEGRRAISSFSYLAISGLIAGFATIVVFFYLLDCLFTERRDRSILFWKSLPVSDSQVVLSKLATALVAVPVGVLLLSAATQLVLLFAAWLRFHGTPVGEVMGEWDALAWLRSQAVTLVVMLGGLLWYAPLAAYFLLLSVWARRLVFLWAVVPLIAIPVLEGFFLHSSKFLHFLGQRLGGYLKLLNVNPEVFKSPEGGEHIPHLKDVLDALHLGAMFTSLEMWIGVAVAAAMAFATIRIRRYRDDA
jgi:ABC-2 type transport system permease protein